MTITKTGLSYTATSLEDIAAEFDRLAKGCADAEKKAPGVMSQHNCIGQAYAYGQAAAILRATKLEPPKGFAMVRIIKTPVEPGDTFIDASLEPAKPIYGTTERLWEPHLGYDGEPMEPGQFRDPPSDNVGCVHDAQSSAASMIVSRSFCGNSSHMRMTVFT